MKILLLNQTFHPDVMATSQYLTDLALALTLEAAETCFLMTPPSSPSPRKSR